MVTPQGFSTNSKVRTTLHFSTTHYGSAHDYSVRFHDRKSTPQQVLAITKSIVISFVDLRGRYCSISFELIVLDKKKWNFLLLFRCNLF